MNYVRSLSILLTSVSLVSCGGGGAAPSGDSASTPAPTVSLTRLLAALPLLLAFVFNSAFASMDSDGDGFNDDVDIFPEDAEEWFDSDADGVGDNDDIINNPAELVALSFVNLSDTCSAPKGFVFVLNGVRSPEIPPGTRFVAAVSVGDHVLEHYIDGVFYSQIKKTIYKEKTYLGHGCDWDKYDPSNYPIILD